MIKLIYCTIVVALVQSSLLAEGNVNTETIENLKVLFDNVYKNSECLLNIKSVWKTNILQSCLKKTNIDLNKNIISNLQVFSLTLLGDDQLSFPIRKGENILFEESDTAKIIRVGNDSFMVERHTISQLLSPVCQTFASTPELDSLNVNWVKYTNCSYHDIKHILNATPPKDFTVKASNVSLSYDLFLKGLMIEFIFGDRQLFCVEGVNIQVIFSHFDTGFTGVVFTENNHYSVTALYDSSYSEKKREDLLNATLWLIVNGHTIDAKSEIRDL
jgi:hypothetical protein